MPLGIKQYGKVGGDVSEAEARLCARSVALCMLASVKEAVGDLDLVKRVIRLYGMVNCAPDFDRHMTVIDGASDLFYELWGPIYGRHARAAVGIAGLPRGAVLEIMGEFEVHATRKRSSRKHPTRRVRAAGASTVAKQTR
jgi:enamine deaminase RidA (YjgF/YER057c/UK114 family)